ncbi:MAG: Holliday junction branch migration protein RuvA [Candidatus Pacebacteria bacterium]|nr:Holliday junction branch migration protein RuvA [Candidatus Paceibacterota bacterium]
MIGSIRGSIINKDLNRFIIETTGVGYEVITTSKNLDRLIEAQTYFVYIYTSVRENAIDLYGFLSLNEKDMFTTLLDVSGIGPKSALGVLNSSDVETIVHGIKTEDPEYLVKMGGLGKKMAEKIVYELKGKTLPIIDGDEHVPEADDALLALEALGYSLSTARDTLRMIDQTLDTRTKVREALKILSNN